MKVYRVSPMSCRFLWCAGVPAVEQQAVKSDILLLRGSLQPRCKWNTRYQAEVCSFPTSSTASYSPLVWCQWRYLHMRRDSRHYRPWGRCPARAVRVWEAGRRTVQQSSIIHDVAATLSQMVLVSKALCWAAAAAAAAADGWSIITHLKTQHFLSLSLHSCVLQKEE